MDFIFRLVLFHDLRYAFQCVEEVHRRRFGVSHRHLTVVIAVLVMPLHDKAILGSRNTVFECRLAGLIIYLSNFNVYAH